MYLFLFHCTCLLAVLLILFLSSLSYWWEWAAGWVLGCQLRLTHNTSPSVSKANLSVPNYDQKLVATHFQMSMAMCLWINKGSHTVMSTSLDKLNWRSSSDQVLLFRNYAWLPDYTCYPHLKTGLSQIKFFLKELVSVLVFLLLVHIFCSSECLV